MSSVCFDGGAWAATISVLEPELGVSSLLVVTSWEAGSLARYSVGYGPYLLL